MLFAKIKKDLVSQNLNKQRKKTKNTKNAFLDIGKYKICANFQQKNETVWYLELANYLSFSDMIELLGNDRAFSKFK